MKQTDSSTVTWRAESSGTLIPSWLGSIIVHAGLFLACITLLKDCRGEPGISSDDYGDRIVGVYVKSDNKSTVVQEDLQPVDDSQSVTDPESLSRPLEFAGPESRELDRPPVPLDLPEPIATIGSSGRPLPESSASPSELLPDNPAVAEPIATGAGQGQTSMFGIRDSGQRFVYVIDSSGSMYGDPMRVAKAELIASLRSLNRSQEFAIIFYNKAPHVMELRGHEGERLYRATDYNRAAANDFIYREQPQAGTDHMLALRLALGLKPDVIYFLTDAKQPVLKTADLHEIDELNRGTRIHCIEFGSGADLELDSNFLRRLARRNKGGYSYRDIRQFGQRLESSSSGN